MLSLPVFSVLAIDDDTIGNFNLVEGNAPIIAGWFETDDVFSPYADVTFNATVIDLDNTSDELTVKLFYSVDSFDTTNISIDMVFDSEIIAGTYYYELDFSGMAENTYIEYYYWVTDGNFTDREPAIGEPYLSIQWQYQAITLIRHPPSVTLERVEELNLLPYALLLTLISLVLFLIIGSKARSQSK